MYYVLSSKGIGQPWASTSISWTTKSQLVLTTLYWSPATKCKKIKPKIIYYCFNCLVWKQNSLSPDLEIRLHISPVGLHSCLLSSHSKELLGRMVDTFLGHRHTAHTHTHTLWVPLIFGHLRISTFSKWLRFVVFVANPRKRQRIDYSAVEVKDVASQYTKVSGIMPC